MYSVCEALPGSSRTFAQLADLAWKQEVEDWDSHRSTSTGKAWKAFCEENPKILLPFIAPGSVIFVAHGSSRLEVLGDVGSDSTLIISRGGAAVEIHGNVEARCRIVASGGRASVSVYGTVDATSTLRAIGGGSKIIREKPIGEKS